MGTGYFFGLVSVVSVCVWPAVDRHQTEKRRGVAVDRSDRRGVAVATA